MFVGSEGSAITMGPGRWGRKNSAIDLFTLHFLNRSEFSVLVYFLVSVRLHWSSNCCIWSE